LHQQQSPRDPAGSWHHPIPAHLVEHDLQGPDRQRDRHIDTDRIGKRALALRDVNKVIADGLDTSPKLIAKLLKWGAHRCAPETERHDAIARLSRS
jgi:hypothetical protein